ncbi:MAG TPA: hypothetical protein VN154_11520 [Rhizomicrobium sp.]|nr:hypothetical protein [Rhizomicrobium sp.]
MAVSLPKVPARPATMPEPAIAANLPGPLAHAYLARLAALHDEAAETAHLANLLGRTPWASAALGSAALLCAFTGPWQPSVAAWLGMIAISIGLVAVFCRRANRAPFDRDMLKVFARNISAGLLFAGVVWGAGVSLVLPAAAGFQTTTAFVAGMAAVIAAILRARDVGFCFLISATAMGAFCALVQNLDGAAMAGILMGGAVIVATMLLMERVSSIATLIDRRG